MNKKNHEKIIKKEEEKKRKKRRRKVAALHGMNIIFISLPTLLMPIMIT